MPTSMRLACSAAPLRSFERLAVMRLLALDTATEACSAALWIDGDVTERYVVAPRQHATLILPMAQALLADARLKLTDLNAIAFGCGPGSFTGVRIAVGVAQGLALGASLPVAPVSDLAALAQRSRAESGCDEAWVAFDARMDEVYWGVYGFDSAGMAYAIRADCVISPDRVSVRDDGAKPGSVSADRRICGVGAGWGAYGERLGAALGGVEIAVYDDRLPRAREVAQLAARKVDAGDLVSPEAALPTYLHNKVAQQRAGVSQTVDGRLIGDGKKTQRQ